MAGRAKPRRTVAFNALVGIILSTYYGGRTDAKMRREVLRVLLTDFVSLYPTVAILAGLWRFIIGQGFRVRKVTNSFRRFLENITFEDLLNPLTWMKLNVLVMVDLDGDVLPVRAMYQKSSVMRTIGLNHHYRARLWYTAFDVVASKLRTGRAPTIVKALEFIPGEPQPGLRTIRLAGSAQPFDAYKDDFFRCIVELRIDVKKQAGEAARRGDKAKAQQLLEEYRHLVALARCFDDEQKHLKVVANASYGFFVEMNDVKLGEPAECAVYSYRGGEERTRWFPTIEQPGPYFHPLVGTLITGGARLMLMVLEMLAEREGVRWMMCDTDSMAFARPHEMDDDEFVRRVQRIREALKPLNPYRNVDSILKFEPVNYRPNSDELEPLYGLAIAPKSYALFNLDKNRNPILREAKQFLLENYVAPYTLSKPEEKRCKGTTKLRCWQRDVWLRVISGFLDGHPDTVDLSGLPNFDLPAARRISISTTNVEKHVQRYNMGRPYRERIRPGGFLLSFTPKSDVDREYLAYEHNVDRQAKSPLPPREEAQWLYESVRASEMPWWDALRDTGGRIIPDNYWDHKLRRWKRSSEFADLPRRLLAANKNSRGETATIVYGNIDVITDRVRERTGNFDLTTSDVIAFFLSHRRPPIYRDFLEQARENTLGWSNELRPLAPYDPDIAKAAERCFNAYGNRKVERWELKTYADVFKNFHLRPEYKYGNACGSDRGETHRKHVAPASIDVIGKETLRYARDQIGVVEPAKFSSEGSLPFLKAVVQEYGVAPIARHCRKSADTIARILNGDQEFRTGLADLVRQFVEEQEAQRREDAMSLERARAACQRESLRAFARRAGVYAGRLSECLTNRRRLTKGLRTKLKRALEALATH